MIKRSAAGSRKPALSRPRFKIGNAAFVRKFAIHEAAGKRVVVKGIICSLAEKRPQALKKLASGPIYLAELALPNGQQLITIVSEAHLESETSTGNVGG